MENNSKKSSRIILMSAIIHIKQIKARKMAKMGLRQSFRSDHKLGILPNKLTDRNLSQILYLSQT